MTVGGFKGNVSGENEYQIGIDTQANYFNGLALLGAGPGPADGSSIVWLYHSHVKSIEDTNSGLVGAMIITAKGKAKPDGTPKDIDREFINLFTVMDENVSWYLEENKTRTFGKEPKDGDAFEEGNLMHTINGYG